MATNMMRVTAGVWVGAVFLLAGCASVAPDTIRLAPPGDVRIAEVRRDPSPFIGTTVRWGGQIVKVQNLREETVVELVGRRLDSDGRPYDEDASEGRFRVRVKGFLDPSIYTAGRELTVRGKVERVVEESIGEHRYLFPQLDAEQVYLWPPRPVPLPYPYYDPYWNPWYPWGWPYYPYPYYSPRYYYPRSPR
jgi:outer membrane lipoprotein